MTVVALADLVGARIVGDGDRLIEAIAPLSDADAGSLSFLISSKKLDDLKNTKAGAVFVKEKFASYLPENSAALIVSEPERAFALAGRTLYPAAVRPQAFSGESELSSLASIDPSARVEEGAIVEPFAVIGPGCAIGSGTVIGSHAVIGHGCQVGRDCSIGPGVTLQACLLGDRIIAHPGVRIGNDGFGFVGGASGHDKLVQIGRVIIQDDVEIGANTTVDRGAMEDTVIGAGTKIDNLVQIGHNARIGRHCILVAHSIVGGSAVLGDFAVIGGNTAVNNHITVGTQAQVGAFSAVARNVPDAARWGGIPARPMRAFLRDVADMNARAFPRENVENKKGSGDG